MSSFHQSTSLAIAISLVIILLIGQYPCQACIIPSRDQATMLLSRLLSYYPDLLMNQPNGGGGGMVPNQQQQYGQQGQNGMINGQNGMGQNGMGQNGMGQNGMNGGFGG